MRSFFKISFFIILITYEKDNFYFTDKKRSPASVSLDEKIANKLTEVCESYDQSISFICSPYYQTKETVRDTGIFIQKKVESTITPELSAVSGFLIKSLFEKKVKIEYKSQFGTPSVSIQDNNTKLEWVIQHNF